MVGAGTRPPALLESAPADAANELIACPSCDQPAPYVSSSHESDKTVQCSVCGPVRVIDVDGWDDDTAFLPAAVPLPGEEPAAHGERAAVVPEIASSIAGVSGAPAPVGKGINTQQDLSGEDIAFAPDFTAALMPTLEYDVYKDWPLALSFDVLYQGEHYTDTDLDPATRVPANTIFSTRARLATSDQSWSFTVGVKNLTDKNVLNQVSDALFFPGTYYAQQAQARVVYGSVRFAF